MALEPDVLHSFDFKFFDIHSRVFVPFLFCEDSPEVVVIYFISFLLCINLSYSQPLAKIGVVRRKYSN